LHRETRDGAPRAAFLVGTTAEFHAWANRHARAPSPGKQGLADG
jgi:hypothetical protein